jgi:hypothetical protein
LRFSFTQFAPHLHHMQIVLLHCVVLQ